MCNACGLLCCAMDCPDRCGCDFCYDPQCWDEMTYDDVFEDEEETL